MWFCLCADAAFADKRVALVIGMSEYQHVPRLENPAHDADLVAGLLKRAGFDVVTIQHDLGVAALRRAIRDFSLTAADADVAVVYFAGHGIEVNGTNYLIPADARLLSDFDIEDETISLDRVMWALSAVKRLRLVILDACRDNPFAKTMKRTIASRAIGRGLAKVEPDVANTLIAFAAKAGALANDGEGANSPFAAALVKHIAEPGLDLRIAFGRVRDEVLRTTGNRQEPFVYGSLGGDTMALVPQTAKPADPEATARVDYELAAQVGTREAWESFLKLHQSGFYADLARAQNAKLLTAEQSLASADEMRTKAEEQAAQKAQEFRKKVEEQIARQPAEAKQKLSGQAKKDLEEARLQAAEQARKELDAAKEQARLSEQKAQAARAELERVQRQAAADARARVEEAKRRAKLEAERLALSTPTEPAEPAQQPPQMDSRDVARLLQAHLKRVGCDPGNTDGNWDDSSKKALDLFNRNARTRVNAKVASLDALDAVRGKTDRVCPLICATGQRAEDNRCVQISCPTGHFLNSSGACEKRTESAPKARTGGRGSGRCFTFSGRTYCE
ncbi:MAG: caspase family protein [Bradyrhizobium sp.]|nr:caspase family protein [Bradyrhizobium sp.]